MKIFKKTCLVFAGIATLGTVSSCKKLLVEEPRAALYPSYFSTAGGVAAGITGVYRNIKGSMGGEEIRFWAGTDESIPGSSSSSDHKQIDIWNGLNSSNTQGFGGYWADINTLNGILKYANDVTGLTAVQKNQYISQAKFLRAWEYFFLVQTFGGTTATEKSGIPLHLDFVTEATTADAPAPMADIYNQIIKDLTEAAASLPNTIAADNPFSAAGVGKTATKAVANTYLAKVYLTRGYNPEIAQPGDFQKAADLTAEVIANKGTYGLDLWQSYADEHKVENDYGKENMFNIDFGLGGTDELYTGYTQQGDGGWGTNFLYVIWRWDYIANAGVDNNAGIDDVPQIVNTNRRPMRRDNYNGRPYARIAPNGPYLYNVMFPNRIADSRYDATFQTFWISNQSGVIGRTSTNANKPTLISTSNFSETSYNIPVDGDTAILITNGDVDMARRDAFKGLIIEPAQINQLHWPTVKKFDDTRRTRLNDKSARPKVLLRFSEVYMLNAEANYMLGNIAAAATQLNVLRRRAGYRNPSDGDRIPKHAFRVTTANMAAANAANMLAMELTPAQLAQLAVPYNRTAGTALNGLDLILDEYSREFFGDERRWYDLVRTRYLVRRAKMYRTGLTATNVKDEYMRRAIPQSLINSVLTGPKYPQNNGYN
nr:RagB/SusD family nutrient uptake outer membrane protein [uncultured Mucilaginibacter sp.]